MQRADTIIFLDFNRYTCLYRAFKRRVMYAGKSRPCMTEGCNEKIDWKFVQWIWTWPKRVRSGYLAWLAQIPPSKQVFHLKGRRAVRNFLAQLEP
ncbi:MAG: hypothetical protein FWB76_04040 [Oscillospiraceae bacterium]|nr:hypothetical protein [Oscillospiraceae bacterium]